MEDSTSINGGKEKVDGEEQNKDWTSLFAQNRCPSKGILYLVENQNDIVTSDLELFFGSLYCW